MTKQELRREFRRRLRAVGGNRVEESRAIVAAISAHPAFASTRTLALYVALPGEPDLNAFLERKPCRICYPRVDAGGMVFYEVQSSGELADSAWHPKIREPLLNAAREVQAGEIDLILVPGLAFTRDGHRLGRGGGFYDRYLAALPATTVKLGVCFESQIVENLPLESHDQRVHAVATENGITTPEAVHPVFKPG